MFASGPMGLAVLCLLQAGAQIEVGARLETRAGELPEGSTVMVLAIPALRLDWFAGANSLKADLSTQILWQPVSYPDARPLFLETLTVSYDVRPSMRSQGHLDLSASYGEQDYTSLSRQFATQPSLPFATTMFMISGAADASWRSSRQTSLAFRLGASHRRSLAEVAVTEDEAQAVAVSTLPTQTMVTVDSQLRLALSRMLAAELSLPVSVYHMQEVGEAREQDGDRAMSMVSLQPQLHLSASLTQSERLRLVAGGTYANLVRGTSTGSRHQFSPLAHLGFDSARSISRSTRLNTSASVQSAWIMDPVLGRGIWRAIAQLDGDAQFGPRWSAGLRFSSAFDISKPADSDTGDSTWEEGTLVAVDVMVRRLWTHVLVAELGGRYSERGPHISSAGFAFREREIWGFITLQAGLRTRLNTRQPFRSISGSGL